MVGYMTVTPTASASYQAAMHRVLKPKEVTVFLHYLDSRGYSIVFMAKEN